MANITLGAASFIIGAEDQEELWRLVCPAVVNRLLESASGNMGKHPSHSLFRKEKFEEKSIGVAEPIKKLKNHSEKTSGHVVVNVEKETARALQVIDIASCRGYDLGKLFAYELSSRSLFLTRNRYLTKPDKSQLVHQLESTLQIPPVTEMQQSPGKASVIDFMAIARKVPIKSWNLKTNVIIKENLSLASHFEEADERILKHISHMTLTSNVSNVVICSTDIDVVVSALCNYHVTWKTVGLQKLWVAFGVRRTLRYIPLQSLVTENRVSHTVLIYLPAIHSRTGCNTTSKVSTKLAALKTAVSYVADLLFDFGKEPLNEDMEKRAEVFLVHPLSSNLCAMDKLRFYQYHHNKYGIYL
ncbi:hypothetical protein PR048_030162 [Dryococelus australis]|uniref:Uncharacterized protein n=1 Tax=Dryococelus australis TaxID=614101 RepID=A0ABQ9G8L3_9NEOP|nr:hypothetical protein PR048_030162 [Dryococelus australis]